VTRRVRHAARYHAQAALHNGHPPPDLPTVGESWQDQAPEGGDAIGDHEDGDDRMLSLLDAA